MIEDYVFEFEAQDDGEAIARARALLAALYDLAPEEIHEASGGH